MNGRARPWHVETVDRELVERLTALHGPFPKAVAIGVDIMGDPHRETDEGYNWTVLSRARNVADVVPGSAIVMGSGIGNYLAKVVAWDFEVSDDDPIVVLDLVPLTPGGRREGPCTYPHVRGLTSPMDGPIGIERQLHGRVTEPLLDDFRVRACRDY